MIMILTTIVKNLAIAMSKSIQTSEKLYVRDISKFNHP